MAFVNKLRLSQWLLASLSLSTLGCVSSSTYDELDRRYQLAQMSESNRAHERDLAAQDLRKARAEIRRLEHQIADLKAENAEQARYAASDRDSLATTKAAAQATAQQLQQLRATLANVRAQLASGSLSSKAARQKLLSDIDAALPASGGAAVSH